MDIYGEINCKIVFKEIVRPIMDFQLGSWRGIVSFPTTTDFQKAKSLVQEKIHIESMLGDLDVRGDAIRTGWNDTDRTIDFVGTGPLYRPDGKSLFS